MDMVTNNRARAISYIREGNAYQQKGEQEKAIRCYDQAIVCDSSFALAHHKRGVAYADSGEYERAIQDYD